MKVLLTGGASGLGEQIGRMILTDAANELYFTYNSSTVKAKAITDKYTNAHSIKCDFTIDSDVESLIQAVDSIKPDVLINNAIAGPVTKKHFHKTGPEVFLNGFLLNVMPVIKLTQAVIPVFRRNKFGKIITILTSYVEESPIGVSEYVASKAYLLALSKIWAKENAVFNISANCISPSMMETALTQDIDERVIENIIKTEPLKRLINPEEVAGTVMFILKASQFLNGENIVLNSSK